MRKVGWSVEDLGNVPSELIWALLPESPPVLAAGQWRRSKDFVSGVVQFLSADPLQKPFPALPSRSVGQHSVYPHAYNPFRPPHRIRIRRAIDSSRIVGDTSPTRPGCRLPG